MINGVISELLRYQKMMGETVNFGYCCCNVHTELLDHNNLVLISNIKNTAWCCNVLDAGLFIHKPIKLLGVQWLEQVQMVPYIWCEV